MKTIFRLIVRLGIIAIILVGIQKVLTTPRYLQAIMPYVNQVEELLEKKTNSAKYTLENDDGTAGTTDTTTDEQTKRIIKATVYLNRYYLESATYGYSEQRIINTAEHELGHAIGLDHTNEVSVMQPAGSYYTIQPRDVDVVKKLYQEN